MQSINLLPRTFAQGRAQRSISPKVYIAGAGTVPMLACIFVLIGYMGAHSKVASEQAQFATLQAEVAKFGPATTTTAKATSPAAAANQWDAVIAERTSRRAELDDVLNHELQWDSTLGDIARVLPDRVWLTQLNVTTPAPFPGAATTSTPAPTSTSTSSTATTGGPISISGTAESNDDVALLLERLALLPNLSGVKLESATFSGSGKSSLVSFSVSAQLAPPPTYVPPAPVAPPAPATASGTTTTTTTTPSGK